MTYDQPTSYVRTRDGVSIAYVRIGTGAPMLMVPNLWGQIALTTRVYPALLTENRRRAYETIVPDARGTGASQRDVSEVSLETRLLDIEAVVDALGLEAPVLMATSHGGPPAIAFAARHPSVVSKLILMNTYARGAAYYELAPVMRAFSSIEGMARDQWEFYTRTVASAILNFGEPERAGLLAEMFRETMTPDMLFLYRDASRTTDVTNLLGEIKCPTLIIDDRSSPLRVEELSREMASGIPGARLVTLAGEGTGFGLSTQRAIDEFLGVAPDPGEAETRAEAQAQTAVIMFTDIADSTALTERLGDAAFRNASRALDEGLRAAISACGGSAVAGKVLGDGVLATFRSAAQAIDAARRCHELSAASELGLHIGVHAGDVIHEDDNVYGGAVNIASRICDLSPPGEVLVSDVVRGMARSSAGVDFDDRGEHSLKGIAEPVRIYAVRAG